ncbi:MAG: DEAD/DEAH box helicase family protein [Candidatus Eisenbacteria bacterium]
MRDYLLHLAVESPAGKYQTLWPHQRDAILRSIFVNEILKPHDAGWKDLLPNVVTGGGKTTIIAAIMAYLRVCHEVRSFLLLSPNTIVRERLKTDFEKPSRDDSVWRRFNLFPPEFAHYVHDMTLHVLQPGAGSAGIRSAAVTLGNIHQLYPSSTQGAENLGVILNHLGRIAVFNDEAHNTVAPKYDEILDLLSQSGKTVMRVDTTATPDRADGESPRSRMICFYGIKEAVKDGIIKTVYVCQPNIKTVELTYTDTETGQIARVEEVPWEEIDAKQIPATKWVTSPKPLRQQLEMAKRRWIEQVKRAGGKIVGSAESMKLGGQAKWRRHQRQEGGHYRPILFVVAVSIKDAYNAKRVLEEELGLKTFVIASKDEEETDISPEQRKTELEVAMTIGTDADKERHSAVVSVLMLREGWDVKPVSVIALLRKFSSKVYGQQVIGRGLRRVFPCKRDEKERLIVVDHPKLDHEWLWQMIDAYVKTDVGLQDELDLDEGLRGPEEIDLSKDEIEIPEPQDEGEEIELPEPEGLDEKPLGQDWTEYLADARYPREQVAVTREERVGESERDLTGTGFVTTVAYSETEKQVAAEFVPPKETIPVGERQKELCDQLFDLTVEVLFNNGLPMSGRAVMYRVLLTHISDKFLGGQTIGQCETESQLLFLQDTLHYVRRVFDRRELLKAILARPPET